MKLATPSSYFVGWDVGAWNCDKNGTSRDAIVILDEQRVIVGEPWRGNLRFKEHIQWASDQNQLAEVGGYLRSLPEDQWYHFGEL